MPSRSLRSARSSIDRDLVAEVQVDRRLVEDEQRCGLGDGERDEDELPLAEAQLAGVPAPEAVDADPLDRRVDGGAIGGTRPAEGVLVREPAERHDLLHAGREGERHLARHGGKPAGDRRAVEAGDRVAAQRHRPAGGGTSPARTRRSVDLPAPFGPTSATRSPGAIARSTPRSTTRSR